MEDFRTQLRNGFKNKKNMLVVLDYVKESMLCLVASMIFF